jgi:CubicO group peptidase (beta-lactamase class C family)
VKHHWDWRIVVQLLALLLPSIAGAQATPAMYDQLKDSIVVRYNRNDFAGIYQLSDTAFRAGISRDKLIRFLKGNRNSGDVLGSRLMADENGHRVYLLEAQGRDFKLLLKANTDGTFSKFGFANIPMRMLDSIARPNSTNPRRTALDRAVDSLALEYFHYAHAAALAIGIIENGRKHNYYYAAAGTTSSQFPAGGTRFEIASITKTFTATLLAQAVLERRLRLDDDIRQYLPGEYLNLSFDGHAIRVRDLANHTSRLPSSPDDVGEQPGFNPMLPELNYDTVRFYSALRRVLLDTVPGNRFEYSNWNTALLGAILQRVYHKPYADLLHEFITGPWHMKDTRYHAVGGENGHLASPVGENGRRVPHQDLGIFGPSGDIRSTLPDMLVYLSEQIAESNAAVRLTHQPTANGVGLAWGVRSRGAYRDIQHNGSSLGGTSHISAFPELGAGCVILSNSKAPMGKLIVSLQELTRRAPAGVKIGFDE